MTKLDYEPRKTPAQRAGRWRAVLDTAFAVLVFAALVGGAIWLGYWFGSFAMISN